MNNLVVLVVAVAALVAGWFVGSSSGREAKEALARAEAAGQSAKSEHDKAVGVLNQRLASLTGDYEREKQKLDADHSRQSREFDAILAKRDGRIAELTRARGETQAEVQRLKDAIAAAPPAERERLQRELDRRQGEQKTQETQIAGLQCLEVPVPPDVLVAWRGGQP
jgi:chromosome segregation ATPase